MNKLFGQDKLCETIEGLINNNKFPRFVLVYGMRGSGKKTLAKEIAKALDATLVKPEDDITTVEYLRDTVTNAYCQTRPTVYLIPEIDSGRVSVQAKNTLLKVTEEVPNNAYFIMTALKRDYVLPTIKSRASVFNMQQYTQYQLKEFAESNNIKIEPRLYSILTTPGEVLSYAQTSEDSKDFETFTQSVVDNIGLVSGPNSFKIANKISFGEDDKGFNLLNFWILFKQLSLEKAKTITNSKRNMYFSYIRVTSEYIDKLQIKGINKKAIFDLWIMEVRDIYFKYNK